MADLGKVQQMAEQLKKVRLQTMRHQYELMQMELNERVAQFFNWVIYHTNQMNACAIEESKKLEELKLEDLQCSLEAREQRLTERSTEKVNQVLQAQTYKNGRYHGKSGDRNRGRGDYKGKSTSLGYQDQERCNQDQPTRFTKGGGISAWRGGKKKVNRKRIKCFNCNKVGHFSTECQALPRQLDFHKKQHHDEAHMVKEENGHMDDEAPILLTVTTSQGNNNKEIWYVDSGCSNHMTCHRDWLVNFDSSKKSKVRFADNIMIQAEGIGDVVIKRRDGKNNGL
ncbi:PREDICTED: uncharacterized protein LOC109339635 [Lupinus angustifolius]|uniref:uncharacterized protein LOC109339635 n=1 Tax=Lupinus angustifolius TaxID=3871 RepID=UPI00092E26BE|nr:PREDICTED: uncharacterized protein LOC109339635 [Lupinus angustifolius]